MDKKKIKEAGFMPIRRSPRRLIANVQGLWKSGKTTFALSGPKPIGYIPLEIGGAEGVVDKLIKPGQDSNENIQEARIKIANPEDVDPSQFPDNKDGRRDYDDAVSLAVQCVSEDALYSFDVAYHESLKNFRLTVVDTGSDLWELVRLANFGRLEKIPQLAYTQINKYMDKLIDDAIDSTGSVLFLHHMKDKGEMVEDSKGKKSWQPSGNYVLSGYGGIQKRVQATIQLWREDLDNEHPNEATGRYVKFFAEIIDSRHNANAIGQTFEDDEISFSNIARMIIEGSTPEDWI